MKVLYDYGRHHPSTVLMPNRDIVMTYVVRTGWLGDKETRRRTQADRALERRGVQTSGSRASGTPDSVKSAFDEAETLRGIVGDRAQRPAGRQWLMACPPDCRGTASSGR